jgi:hypothetical protein
VTEIRDEQFAVGRYAGEPQHIGAAIIHAVLNTSSACCAGVAALDGRDFCTRSLIHRSTARAMSGRCLHMDAVFFAILGLHPAARAAAFPSSWGQVRTSSCTNIRDACMAGVTSPLHSEPLNERNGLITSVDRTHFRAETDAVLPSKRNVISRFLDAAREVSDRREFGFVKRCVTAPELPRLMRI